jgi:hypothetical protein
MSALEKQRHDQGINCSSTDCTNDAAVNAKRRRNDDH